MKCRYCGSNLGMDDAVCPYCGRENEQGAGHRALMSEARDTYDRTRREAASKTRTAGRIGRLIVIGLMLAAILTLWIGIRRDSDIEAREKQYEKRIAGEVSRNGDAVADTLREMEENREYLAMNCYMLNYRLRSNEAYQDYARVFTAVISYGAICDDILNILGGFDGYREKTDRDWCEDAALYISDWDRYVGGAFWHDPPASPMHKGEHGAFLVDIKKDTQDMVQVYFGLTDAQASAMWEVDPESLGALLYESYRATAPEG